MGEHKIPRLTPLDQVRPVERFIAKSPATGKSVPIRDLSDQELAFHVENAKQSLGALEAQRSEIENNIKIVNRAFAICDYETERRAKEGQRIKLLS